MKPIRRLPLTLDNRKCPFGCTYCFTRFSQYEPPLSLEELEAASHLAQGIDVLYLACDVDLFAYRRWSEYLDRAVAFDRSISVATKAALSSADAARLGEIAAAMRSRGLVLKLAVSCSTASRITELEPRTATFAQRIENLRLLREVGVTASLLLRPLLPDVADEEYEQIVEVGMRHTSLIVIGDEYVDEDEARRRPTGVLSAPVAKRAVGWLRSPASWPVRMAGERRKAHLTRAVLQRGGQLYHSDLDLMAALLARGEQAAGA